MPYDVIQRSPCRAFFMHKIILVTGASRGIGAATALQLAEQGYAVVVNYRTQADKAQAIVEQIEHQGGTAWALQADVSNEQQVINLFLKIRTLPGQLAGLVNNAGRLQKQMRVIEMDAKRLQDTFNSNLISQFLCCREAVKLMSTELGGTGGAIVNVSSTAARIGAANEYVDYAAAKGGVDTLTIGLAQELAQAGIRVNGVRPGFIDTEMHADGGEPGRIQRLAPAIPLRRGGTVDEVANAIRWLISEQASYTTGSFIEVAGGR